MPDDLETDEHAIDAEASFIDRVAAKYEEQDRKSGNTQQAKEDGDDEEESSVEDDDVDDVESDVEDDEETDAADTGAGDDEDPNEDTSAETDEDSDESPKGSAKGKKPDHTEDDESEESDADATPDDDDEATGEPVDEEEDEVSDETLKAVAARLSTPLTLEDVPEGPARKLVQQKILNMDRAFTRAMQAETAYRKEEVQFRSEEQFRRENPEIVMVEMLRSFKDPAEQAAFIDRVNERIDKLGDPDQAKAFEIVVRDARKEAVTKVEQKIAESEHVVSRYQHVESLAKRLATKAGLPWEFAEQAVTLALFQKPEDKRDLTDDELTEIVKGTAKNYNSHVRAHRREASKSTLKDRLANRKSTPGSRTPSAAASPKPATPKRKPINWDNEEERHALMMGTARRLLPGARDE